jgi:hypothetical protein
MKNLLIVLIGMLFTFNAHAFALICNSGSGFDGAGTVISGTNAKCYIKIKNASGSARADGDVMAWDITNDGGYSVTGVATALVPSACVFDAACAAGAVCKCQVYGQHDAVKTDVASATVTAGYGLVQSGTAFKAQGAVVGNGYFAIALDTSAVSGTVEAMINAL